MTIPREVSPAEAAAFLALAIFIGAYLALFLVRLVAFLLDLAARAYERRMRERWWRSVREELESGRVLTFHKSTSGLLVQLGSDGPWLSIVDHRVSRPYFSERHGLTKQLHVGPWCVRLVAGRKRA